MKRVGIVLLLFGLLNACADEAGKAPILPDMGADEGLDVGEDTGSNNVNNPPDPDMAPDPDMTPDPDMAPDPDMDDDMDPDMTDPDMDDDMDPDMPEAVCGNGIVEPGEDCDDETDACGDDCLFVCGNGVVDAGETCDIGIAAGQTGACPTACDDGNACTSNTLQGSACTAECVFGAITACADDDGCCAAGCNANNDNDCMAICGNGIQEPGELCDGDCPTTCNDGNSCTNDMMIGDAATCDVVCVNTPIVACIDNDGCCPAMCDASNDNDCSATCGDGTVDPGETCDGNCPTTCDDGDVCTAGTLSGDPSQCNVECTHTPLACIANAMDGCCPAGCNANTDGDCSAVCGNGVVEPGEECDLGSANGTGGCTTTCELDAVAFRLSDLDLRDPHIFVNFGFFGGCRDFTDTGHLGQPPVNQMLQDAIQLDGDNDGLLDLSFVLVHRPLNQTNGATGGLDVVESDCTAPMSSTACTPTTGGSTQSTTYTSATTGTCLAPIAGTTGTRNNQGQINSTYNPPVTSPSAPCYSTQAFNLTVEVGGIQIPLEDVRIGATYVGNPATSQTNGLLMGFISEEDADNVILPSSLPLIGGDPLSKLLRGGTGNCATGSDKDTGPNGEVGWWFYFNFPANQVPWTP